VSVGKQRHSSSRMYDAERQPIHFSKERRPAPPDLRRSVELHRTTRPTRGNCDATGLPAHGIRALRCHHP
jgi:hypothetical protein